MEYSLAKHPTLAHIALQDDSRYIFAAGSFELDGKNVYAARWDMQDLEWSTLGEADALPGPATAIATDDQDENQIFVAGVSSSDSAEPYFMKWNNTAWTDLGGDALQSGTEFQQIVFVPMSNDRKNTNEDIIEKDRLLMVSGDLSFEEYGRVSSALFDGDNWTPFLVSADASGSGGAIAGLFYSAQHFKLSQHFLSVGIVILISIAIALGVVFLLVLIGLLMAIKNRRADRKAAAYPAVGRYNNGSDDEIREKGRRPTSLLATLNAATALVAADGATKNHQAKRETGPSVYDETDSTEGHGLAAGGAAVGMERHSSSSEDEGEEDVFYDDEGEEIVRMRYSFEYVFVILCISSRKRGLTLLSSATELSSKAS